MLGVVDLWDLPNKRPIAAAAAAAAMQAAGLSHKTSHKRQQEPEQEQEQEQESNKQQQQTGSTQRRGPVARTAADAVLLLHRFCALGYKLPAALTQHLLAFAGLRLHELTPLQVCVGGGGGSRGGACCGCRVGCILWGGGEAGCLCCRCVDAWGAREWKQPGTSSLSSRVLVG